jgi:hypothetical protein
MQTLTSPSNLAERDKREMGGRFKVDAAIGFALIFALQAKVLSGVEALRGITPGDNAWYYLVACDCLARFKTNFLWSPFFAFFTSLLLRISNDALFCATAERVIVVFALSLLFLAVCRQLIPAGAALICATWWAVNPQVFDAVNDVHLFGTIPVFASWLVLLKYPSSRWAKGSALAIALFSSVLIRNEQIIYTAMLGLCFVAAEIREYFQDKRFSLKNWLPYAAPCLCAAVIIGVFYVRSVIHYPAMKDAVQAKQALNFGQSYAYTYHDAHPQSWKGNPYSDYNQLEERDFGGHDLSMPQAFVKNPLCFTAHLWRNSKLIPAGLQVLLFDCRAGERNPDYFGTKQNDDLATKCSLAALLLSAVGAFLMIKNKLATRQWVSAHRWGLTAIICSSICYLVVMAVQMPRPEYVFPLGAAIIAWLGLCVSEVFASIKLNKALNIAAPLTVATVLVLFHQSCVLNPWGVRLGEYYRFLKPFASICSRKDMTVSVPDNHTDLCAMIDGAAAPIAMPHWVNNSDLMPAGSKMPILKALDKNKTNVILLDEKSIKDEPIAALCGSARWQLLALQETDGRALALFVRREIAGIPDLKASLSNKQP